MLDNLILLGFFGRRRRWRLSLGFVITSSSLLLPIAEIKRSGANHRKDGRSGQDSNKYALFLTIHLSEILIK